MQPGEENSAAKKSKPDIESENENINDESSETTPNSKAKRLKNIAEKEEKFDEIFKNDTKKRRITVISDPGASIALQGGSKPKIDSIKPSKPGKKAANFEKEGGTRKRRQKSKLKDYNEDSSESDNETGMLWRTCSNLS